MIFKFNSLTYMLFSHTVFQFLNSKEEHGARDHKFYDIHKKIGITGQEIE